MFYRKSLISIVFLLFLPWLLFAGTTGKISGRVTDAKTGEALIGANVLLAGTMIGAATDLKGNFIILTIPPGSYTLRALMLGYQNVRMENVRVAVDFTTTVDIKLQETAIEMEVLVVTAEKPIIQKDLTATVTTIDHEIIARMPIKDLKEAIQLQTGVIPDYTETYLPGFFLNTPDDGLHFRGGRTNETAYLLNGMTIEDPIWGGFQLQDFPYNAISSMNTYSGTFPAEYGGAMSAVINLVTETAGDKLKAAYNFYTDNTFIEDNENTFSHEFALSSAIPKTKNRVKISSAGRFYTTDGRFNGYILPNWRDSEGKDKSGDRTAVPMNYHDSFSGVGKISWQIFKALTIDLSGFGVKTQKSFYSHYYKYNPYSTPSVKSEDYHLAASLTHVLSPRYYYTLSVANNEKKYDNYVYEDFLRNNVEKRLPSPEFFSVSGTGYTWMKTNSTTKEVRFDLIGQVTNIHQVKLGVDFRDYKVHLERRNPSASQNSVKMDAWEAYTKKPQKLSAYIQDKMEFNNIGMVLNIGLRYDQMDPDAYKLLDIKRPQTSELAKASIKKYWSQRLGVSYPVTDRAAFHFSYGVFYQFPKFYILYQNTNQENDLDPNPDLSALQTAVGNGDLRPEKTTSYEVGVQTRVGENISVILTGFYRDFSDIIGINFIQGEDVPKDYPLFGNQDFAVAKGFEIKLSKRPSRCWSWWLNYTFTKSRISSSSVWYRPVVPVFRTFIANWDRPHTLSLNLDFHNTDNWAFNLVGHVQSGTPYTIELQPNTERSDFLHSFDLKLSKTVKLLGFKQVFYIQVLNILDHKNIYWVYSSTGKPGVDTDPNTSDDYTNDPTAWGPGRRVRAGIKVNF